MRRLLQWGAIGMCLGVLAMEPAVAQAELRMVDVAALLDGFQREAAAGVQESSTATIVDMMLYCERFRPADVERMSRELERLALDASSRDVRGRAAWAFTLAGHAGIRHARSDIVARSARLFASTTDPWVQERLVIAMRNQADTAAAIGFLSDVITAPPLAPSDDTPGRQAVIVLASMGAAGQAALRRLDQPGRVVDKAARRQLDAVAKMGYRNH